MKTRRNNRVYLPLFFALTMVGGYFLGRSLSVSSPSQRTLYQSEFGSKLESILQVIEEKYVDTIDRNAFIDKAINDVLHKLDPHSNYIPASEVARMRESLDGKFGGVGIRFLIHRDTLAVTHVVKNTPSFRAGVLPGDRIVAIDGKSLKDQKLTNQLVMDKLKGEPGTTVKVKVLRQGKSIELAITRGVIPLESISCAVMVDPKIGYIRLEQFSQTSSDEFRSAVLKLKSKGMEKLIFDLRDNGGGVLGGAIQIVDEFLDAGKLIVYTKGANQPERRYTSSSGGMLRNTEVVVLINANSASASEIVAGAIQDNDRGTIMGRRSFGKGLVQEEIPLVDGSTVRLTVARYYTPTGRCIQRPYGENVDYEDDYFHRYESGELYAVDSTKFVDSLKYTTPKGKVVYGGGGIMPDIFLPYDSTGASFYLTQLRYAMAFNHFAFDFANRTGRNQWKDEYAFARSFQVTDALLEEFLVYAEKNHKVKINRAELNRSKRLIKHYLKAEIARQIWIEQGYFLILFEEDAESQAALKFLKKR
jgi:carboxyl-terminal processing protease